MADSIVVEKQRRTSDAVSSRASRAASTASRSASSRWATSSEIGDNRTPEGLFHIDFKNPNSKFHMALHISYPDAAHAATRERARAFAAGGDVMIHGLPPAYADMGAEAQRVRLDGGLYRRDERRDRGDLARGAERRADSDQALSAGPRACAPPSSSGVRRRASSSGSSSTRR